MSDNKTITQDNIHSDFNINSQYKLQIVNHRKKKELVKFLHYREGNSSLYHDTYAYNNFELLLYKKHMTSQFDKTGIILPLHTKATNAV